MESLDCTHLTVDDDDDDKSGRKRTPPAPMLRNSASSSPRPELISTAEMTSLSLRADAENNHVRRIKFKLV